jgi:Mrp family chromosome partitioning ATPase
MGSVVASAAVPVWPVEPNRPRILALGAALAAAASLLVTRIRKSSQPVSSTANDWDPDLDNDSMTRSGDAESGSPEAESPSAHVASAARTPTPRQSTTPRAASEPPRTSSAPRRAAIEINAPGARHIDPRSEPDTTQREDVEDRSSLSRTQAMGSPTPASIEPRAPSAASAPLNVVEKVAGWAPDPTLFAESRLGLRDELYALSGDRHFVVAVTGVSGTSAEKSRVAAELALCLSQPAGSRILLLEANFQRPLVHRLAHVEMPRFAGFSEQLQAAAEQEEALRPWTVIACSRSLHVLAEGLMRVPEMILSREFQRCIGHLRAHYDFVVLDGPLLSEPSACRAVNGVVDGAVVVHTEAKNMDLARASASFPGKRISGVSATG